MAASPHCFCVDGTNIVRGCNGYGGPEFRGQEEADSLRLIAGLAELCRSLGGKVELDLFFDGQHRSWAGAAGGASNLKVRFAHEREADDMILDRVRACAYGGAGRVTVVTADGELGRQASEEGGRWLKVRPGADMEDVVRSIERRLSR